MSRPQIDVRYVAQLARLEITPEEESRLATQLGRVLEYVEKLQTLNVDDVEPTAHASALANVFRADEPEATLPHEHAMANAPAKANGLFIVPKIVE